MERNTPAQPHHGDPVADETSSGTFDVGEEIRERGPSPLRPDVAQTLDREVDASTARVVGDHDDVAGDADAMTGGDSAKPTPDDDAMRPWGRPTP